MAVSVNIYCLFASFWQNVLNVLNNAIIQKGFCFLIKKEMSIYQKAVAYSNKKYQIQNLVKYLNNRKDVIIIPYWNITIRSLVYIDIKIIGTSHS